MAADGRLGLDKLSGAGASVGQAPIWTGSVWKPGSPGGGGLLGYQYVSFTFPNVAANGTTHQASGSATSGASGGTPAVSESSGTITYCTDNVASYYLLIVRANWTGLTGGAATDIFKIEWNDWLTTFVGVAVAIANGFPGPSMSGGGPISSSGGMQPELVATCPSGAGRTLTGVTLQYEILRFAV